MPTVNKLNKGKATAAPAPAAPTKPVPAKPSAPPAKPPGKPPVPTRPQQSAPPAAVVKTDNVNTKALQKAAAGITVPAFLQNATLPQTMDAQIGGYVGFADPQSKKWGAMQAAGLEHGDPFVMVDGQYHQCKPLSYFLLIGDSFRTTMEGQEGKFTFATRDLDTPLRELAEQIEGDSDKAKKRKAACLKAEPHYTCLILALLGGDRLVPVKLDARGTKSGAASSAIIAVKSAEDPEWLKLSDAHRITAAFPHPWGRVWNVVTTKYKVGRTSGNGFFVANTTSKPASIDQMQLLIDHFQDEAFVAQLEEAEKAYQMRTGFLDSVAAWTEDEVDPTTGEPKPF